MCHPAPERRGERCYEWQPASTFSIRHCTDSHMAQRADAHHGLAGAAAGLCGDESHPACCAIGSRWRRWRSWDPSGKPLKERHLEQFLTRIARGSSPCWQGESPRARSRTCSTSCRPEIGVSGRRALPARHRACMSDDLAIFAGRANPRLAAAIAGSWASIRGLHGGTVPDGRWRCGCWSRCAGRRSSWYSRPRHRSTTTWWSCWLSPTPVVVGRRSDHGDRAVLRLWEGGQAQDRPEPIMDGWLPTCWRGRHRARGHGGSAHAPDRGLLSRSLDMLTAVPTLCHSLGDSLPSGATVVSPDVGRVPLALSTPMSWPPLWCSTAKGEWR